MKTKSFSFFIALLVGCTTSSDKGLSHRNRSGTPSRRIASSTLAVQRDPPATPSAKKNPISTRGVGLRSAKAQQGGRQKRGGFHNVGVLTPAARKAFVNAVTDGHYGKNIKRSFYKTNEKRHDLFIPHIKNIGGAYLGVAADHNYTFATHAGARLVVLMDYDRNIVALHKMYLCLIAAEPTSEGFQAWFTYKKPGSSKWSRSKFAAKNRQFEKIMSQCYSKKSVAHIMRIKRSNRRFFPWWHKTVLKRGKRQGYKTWLNPPLYAKWRQIVREGRVVAVLGDLTKAVSLNRVAVFLKKINLPMGVLYFSNAEEYWGTYPKPFRTAITSMPYKKRGLVLRGTFLGGQKGQADNLYHYSIQSIADFAAWMAFPKWISGSYMVHVGKQLLANRGFSRILGPTSQVLARYYRGIRRVKRLRRRRTNQKKSGP